MFKTLCAFALMLALVTFKPIISAAAPTPTPAQDQDDKGKKKGEAHPHIRAAIHELEEAKHELQTAAHDFGGHRVEAIEAIDNAIKQLRQALQYDKK